MRYVIDREAVVLEGTFRVIEAEVSWEQFDGEMSPFHTRKKFDRGDAAAALVHDVDSGELVFVRQFRYPAVGKAEPWLLEIAAGKIDPGETAEQAIRRELREELGIEAGDLLKIAVNFPSPGILSEKISVFYAPIGSGTVKGSQSLDDGEDVRIERIAVDEALAMAENLQIHDSKTLIALYWLRSSPGNAGVAPAPESSMTGE